MALPKVDINVLDGGLGLVTQSAGLVAILGVSSILNGGTIVSLSSKDQVLAALGIGPLAKACAFHLASGGPPVLAVAVNDSVEGETTDLTQLGSGSADLSQDGGAADDYEVIFKITTAGANLAAATAAFVYSLDGGDTYSRETAVPVDGSFVVLDRDGVDTGMTVNWADGTFVVGDSYSFNVTANGFALEDVTDALDALKSHAKAGSVDFLHLAGVADATIGAGVALLLEGWTSVYLYTWILLHARDLDRGEEETEAEWMDALTDDFAEVASTRLAVSAGYAEAVDPLTGEVKRRPASWSYAARLAQLPISRNPLAPKDGPLPGLTALYHDESAVQGLDAERFVTLRKHVSLTGFFVTRGNMMAPTGSDFAEVMHRRIMDAACRAAYAKLVLVLGESVVVDKTTGFIKETEARRIEGAVDAALQAAIGKHVSGVGSQIDREANLLSTKILPVKIAIVPFGYIEAITVDIGFQNPVLR